MKKTVILTILSTAVVVSGSLSPTEITNMVSKIKEERVGISLIKLEETANPFILYVPPKKEVEAIEESEEEVVPVAPLEIIYTLKAIFNKAAFIDDKWYKKGDTIGNYTLAHISGRSVVLKGPSGNKTLNLKKKKKNFIKINRGYR